MLPIQTPECNFTYTAPPSRPDCQDLPCFRHENGTTSFWQPDDSERAWLEKGGTIVFTHHGHGHPMVSLGVMPPEGSAARNMDVNSPEWQKSFVNEITTTMNQAGMSYVNVVLRGDGISVFEMGPPPETIASRKDLVLLLLNSQTAEVRFSPADAKELCAEIMKRAALAEAEEVVATDEEPVHEFFNLSRANYLVLPRALLQSCTLETQRALCSALELVYQEEEHHLGEHWPEAADIEVKLRDVVTGQYVTDPMADYNRGRRRLW